MSERVDPKVIEVEVERPESDEDPRSNLHTSGDSPFRGSTGPIIAGLVVDLADFITPLGLGKLGFPIGAGVGWWLGRQLGLSGSRRLWLIVLGAVYCGVPGTRFLPLGTLIGLISGVRGIGSSLGGNASRRT
jgi:hypothetical protein